MRKAMLRCTPALPMFGLLSTASGAAELQRFADSHVFSTFRDRREIAKQLRHAGFTLAISTRLGAKT
jgi:hypothetical protein